jgi:predicted MFS family arabinose efflux permease
VPTTPTALSPAVRQYLVVTGNYWAFTLTDGALRMLVVLHFHRLGFSPLEIASLFLFYEFFGMVTNLLGGYLGARIGLNRTMNIGLGLQVVALGMLMAPGAWLGMAWVMLAQALSGIAKDLNKMSAKSAIKLLVPEGQPRRLYRWVALLTGSKNALKGAGFFLGGLLLAGLEFRGALTAMTATLFLVWLASLWLLRQDLGRASSKPKFRELVSKSRPVNLLSGARLFLFGARDVWFVVALPVYLAAELGWDFALVGAFLAAWIVGYGMLQSLAPVLTGAAGERAPDGRTAVAWALPLALVPAVIALLMGATGGQSAVLLWGLLVFGALFAVNSSLHSYLIVSYAKSEGVSLDVGFYYMSNAAGRLVGTLLSGWIYQQFGLEACLYVSSGFLAVAALVSIGLPRHLRASPGAVGGG